HDWRARLEGQLPDAGLRLAETLRARTAALDVHDDQTAAAEHRPRGLEGLLVTSAAQHREDAAVRVDELQRWLEELRLGHEVHLAPYEGRHEEVIEEGEVIGDDDRRALGRDLVRVDHARAV